MTTNRLNAAHAAHSHAGEEPRAAALHSVNACAGYQRDTALVCVQKAALDELAMARQVMAIDQHAHLHAWLRGSVQLAVPHDMLISAWGDFAQGAVRHDIVSSLPGARSYAAGTEDLPFLLVKLHDRWIAGGRRPCAMRDYEFDYLLSYASLPGSFHGAVREMRSVHVHGLTDQRTGQDCLYAFFSRAMVAACSLGAVDSAEQTAAVSSTATSIKTLVPFLDTAMRRISLLPQQRATSALATGTGVAVKAAAADDMRGLTERETQVMAWVAMGKTNSEIGSILNISGFTVKNHMQRIFKKLDVFNRAQAVSKITRVAFDG